MQKGGIFLELSEEAKRRETRELNTLRYLPLHRSRKTKAATLLHYVRFSDHESVEHARQQLAGKRQCLAAFVGQRIDKTLASSKASEYADEAEGETAHQVRLKPQLRSGPSHRMVVPLS